VTLQALLFQRAARLQEWPALTAPGWGTLRYPALRNRVEGVALGLMALEPPVGTRIFSARGDAWDWAAEMACACCGLVWAPDGSPAPCEVLGGSRFNDDAGRQAYHDREHDLLESTPFIGGLDHGELLARLAQLNRRLGWDHDTAVQLPLAGLGGAEVRGALWCALYAGSHAVLEPGQVPGWDPAVFRGLLG
jgi:hypothetical protein